jgi:agarase
MRIKLTLALAALAVGALGPVRSTGVAADGYFRVEQREGVWWLISPEGEPTLSIGINHISYEPDRVKGTGPSLYGEAVKKTYPDRNTWGLMALARMRLWGFNTIGAWSDWELWEHKVPYTIILNIASRAGADWQHGIPVDVYNPKFEQAARDIAEELCRPRAGDRYLLGYFTDNELRWGPDWRGKDTMLGMYLKLPPDAPGRKEALEFLRRRYFNEIHKLNISWNLELTDFEEITGSADTLDFQEDSELFLERVARRYFEVSMRAIKAADANHLVLGARFAGGVPEQVMRAARAVDVVSINIYDRDPREKVRRAHEVSGRPILLGEFSFRSEDTGLPNSKGAGPRVPTMAARAEAFRDYVTRLATLPEVVGYHWFQWSDQPKEGRFDGEDSNYGLVNISDEPYASFVEAVKQVNSEVIELHRRAGQ